MSKIATPLLYAECMGKNTGGIMKLIVAGSRRITDYNVVKEAIDGLVAQGMAITTIIEGTARGVDRLASRYAQEHALENIRVPAEWKLYQRGAGIQRNRRMAEMGDAMLALWDGRSRGTMNMIQIAKSLGLPVTVVNVTSTGDGDIIREEG